MRRAICRDWDEINPEDYKGIWVYMQVDEDAINEASLQLLGVAREIADKLNSHVSGVLIGSDVRALANEPIYYGADKVYLVENKAYSTYYPRLYGSVIVELARKYKPLSILVGGTMKGRELAPYIANTLRTGITADCTSFDADPETRDIVLIRPPFGAWMLAHIKNRDRRPIMGSVRPNVFPMPPRDTSRKGEIIIEDILVDIDPGVELVEKIPIEKKEELPIEKAEIIVSGGKGLGTREGFRSLEELADLIGGVVAGSRKAVDAGWIPHEKQVGQTGKSVKPELYIAVAISGAAQHVFGIREAKRVVAINIDPEAPIFDNADYGVVGDYKEIIPAIIEEIKRIRKRV